MSSWKKLREELLSNSETAAEYERLRPQYELASKIVALRKRLDLTQADLAKAAGMKQPQIARIEKGDVSPTWDTLSRIFGAVGAEIDVKVREPGGRLVKV